MFPLCSSADMTFVLVCGTVFICQRYHGHTDERALLGPANLSEKHENVKKNAKPFRPDSEAALLGPVKLSNSEVADSGLIIKIQRPVLDLA